MRFLTQISFSLASATLLLTGLIAPAQAADLRPFDRELAFFANFEDDSDVTTADLDIRLGWLLDNSNQIGIAANFFYEDTSTANSNSGGEIGPFYAYNFATHSRTSVPYVGMEALIPYGDLSDVQDWAWKGFGGFRYIPIQNISYNFGVFYKQRYTANGVDPDSYGFEGGISVFF